MLQRMQSSLAKIQQSRAIKLQHSSYWTINQHNTEGKREKQREEDVMFLNSKKISLLMSQIFTLLPWNEGGKLFNTRVSLEFDKI